MQLTFTALPESPMIRVTREDGTSFNIHSFHITGKLGAELKHLCTAATWEGKPTASRPSPLTPGPVTVCEYSGRRAKIEPVTASYTLEDLGL